jgi:hypothetical protein
MVSAGVVTFEHDSVTIRNRYGLVRERWLTCQRFRGGLEALAETLPHVRNGTVLDGVLTAGVSPHVAVLRGRWPFADGASAPSLRYAGLAGLDLRFEPCDARRRRLEVLAHASAYPLELSPVVEPSADLSAAIEDGYLRASS